MIVKIVTVREYAKLTTFPTSESLDSAQISEVAFDYVCQLQQAFSKAGSNIAHLEGRRTLSLDEHVGVIQAPDGTTIEILPKHVSSGVDVAGVRLLLLRMIQQAMDVKARPADPATLMLMKYPISEWVIRQAVLSAEKLMQRGVRFEYRRIEEQSPYLRGQLDVVKMLRQPPGRKQMMPVRHDIFTSDRPENRLLKSTLSIARQLTREPANWRLTNELLHCLDSVPLSQDFKADFSNWQDDKLMAHYRDLKPWAQLLLGQMNPTTQIGRWQGLSLLFPMAKLFERYVAASLRKRLGGGASLAVQSRGLSLCTHLDGRIFELQPDLLVRSEQFKWVLDTKWKRIDEALRVEKYQLSQADFYQMFAYGQMHLQGRGDLMLIFPSTDVFKMPLHPFNFSENLRLWVVPFDLELEALIEGEWCSRFSWYQSDRCESAVAA